MFSSIVYKNPSNKKPRSTTADRGFISEDSACPPDDSQEAQVILVTVLTFTFSIAER